MNDIHIHPIPLVRIVGRGEMSKFTYLANQGRDVEFGYYAWFLEDDGRKILIDAGGTAEMAWGFGRPKETVTHIQTLAEGLAKLNTTPADIDIVILTHLHLDHVAYVKELTRARFIVQEDELDFARDPHPVDRFYDASVLAGLNIEVVRGDTQVTSRVRTLFTPGHSAGGQSVAIETRQGIAVVTGFCCIHANFEPDEAARKRIAVHVPGININAIQAYESMLRIKNMAAIIIANHDARYLGGGRIPA